MVSLSNQARLLAAQAFNKQVIERKARERQADIDRERREDLLRTTRRRQASIASARNPVEAQRIRDSITETLRSKAEQTRRRRINVEANRKSANVFTRVAKGSNIGVLTGFEAKRDSRGRTIGISKKQSKTRKRTISLLKTEIARQKRIASEGSDLERFLRNERAINQGRVGRAELNRQIAARKKRGLSKTPAQKRASQFFRDSELRGALSARARRKGQPAVRATFGQAVSERARAQRLGSAPFADPKFTFGGRTRQEVIQRGGLFGRRVGGESIDTQLSFIDQSRRSATSQRIGFAQGLLDNINFEGSSQSSLLSIVGNKKIKEPSTFRARLREGVGFFTTEAVPVTKAKLTKGRRGQLVARRKAEDFAKATEARKVLAKQARGTIRRNVFDLEGLGRELDISNLARGREIERQNILAPPRFSLGLSVQRQQAQDPTVISFLEPREFVGLTPAQIKQRQNKNLRDQGFTPSQIRAGVQQGDQPDRLGIGGGLTPAQKKAQAQRITDENKALRDAGLEGFATPALVPATGSPSLTGTFFPPEPTPEPTGNIFSVGLSEQIGISDIFSPTPTPTPKKGTTRPPRVEGDFSILDLSSLIAFDAPARQRLPTTTRQPAPPRETGGFLDFLALEGGLDIGAGFGSEALGVNISFGEALESSILFDPFRSN